MSHSVDFAPCPGKTPPSANPPSSTVVVSILSVKPNSDFEGDDDYVPFYNNRADIYGFVTIAGEQFELPTISENDHPHWDQNGVFRKTVSTSQVPIRIDIWEADEGLTGDDDRVDICPLPDKSHLDLVFDLCSLQLAGDINSQSTQGVISVSGGDEDEDATIRFKVELEDGRPVSFDDLALVEIDLVQVRHQTERLVARKPTVVMARLANNFAVDVTTNLRVVISGGGLNIDDTFPIEVQAGEVKKVYLYENSPLSFPPRDTSYPVAVIASLEDPGSAGLKQDDCRRENDAIQNRILWKVITTRRDFSFLWMKVGTLLDIGNYTPDAHFKEIKDLGHAYIKAIFPYVDPPVDESPFPLSPPTSAALDFLVSVLSAFQIPADALEPFALTFELNAAAIVAGYDRLMGVLPSHDWFKRFSFWGEVTGQSMGEFAPHAVIFLPRLKSEDGLDVGPQMTLPAHELGHTFGLSVDSRLKKSWVCEVDWPVVGALPCGASGGFDEYKHEEVDLQDGNPASGYWVAQGGEPAALLPLLNQEQCNAHCLMGNSPRNAHLAWSGDARWIDAADYNQLLDKASLTPDPEVIFVSGMIAWNDQMYLGSTYHLPQGIPDSTESFGLYAVRFEDEAGKTLSEYGIPINWNYAEFERAMPVTFFGLKLPYSEGTRRIVFLNRGTNTVLALQEVSHHIPSVRLKSPGQVVAAGAKVDLAWVAEDADNDVLRYSLLLSPNGERWWPVSLGLSESSFSLATEALEPGDYSIKVLAHDGVHVGESQPMPLRISG